MSALSALAVVNAVEDRRIAEQRKFTLRYLGDEALRVVCGSIDNQRIEPGLVDAMSRIVRTYKAAGLAANQVGGTQRVIVVSLSTAPAKWNGPALTVMVNPRIVVRSGEKEMAQEGCLSMPGFFTTLSRHKNVFVEFLDEGFAKQGFRVTGFDARCIQHEIDHLDGKLIVDGLARQQRRHAERCAAKAVRT